MEMMNPQEMRALDINCAYFGIEPLQLMENAGTGLANEIRTHIKGCKIAIVAGRGNNGGDAFVAARHLREFEVKVFLLGRSRDITTPEAKKNWEILKKLGYDLVEVKDTSDLDQLKYYDMIVDAILGTGIKGEVRGLEAQAINAMNNSGRYLLSVDVPSGLGTTKTTMANHTVTFHKPKTGLAGSFSVIDIGIPKSAEYFVGPGDLQIIGIRKQTSHKGDSGRILVIGGGAYTGAPVLTAMGALRTGADIVTIAAPKSVSKTIAGYSPNLIVRSLLNERLCPDDLDILKPLIEQHHVTVLGMGLGRSRETFEALKEIIPLAKKTVIDADALLPDLPLKGIVTPHAGEFKRISGFELPQSAKRDEIVANFAKDEGLVVLVKGRVDIITDGKTIRANTTGNPGMTVGGTGDVLAGVTAALYSIAPPLQAAVAAAYVNGLAGDMAFEEKGFGLVATDVIDKLPNAMIHDGGNR